jgi:carboxyl-terminal processing protease
MQIIKHPLLLAALAAISLFFACKKKDQIDVSGSSSEERLNQVKDSVLEYSRDLYLWYRQIPTAFNARSYAGPQEVMTALRQYSTEPGFSQPVDRWSFAIAKNEWDNASSGISNGDFGLNVFFRQEGDLRVRAVERDSPAGRAGVRRGWRITAINSNTNMTTGNADFIVQAVYGGASGSFTFQKPDGSSVTLNLSAATYREHAVVMDSIYNVNGRKTGYLVFNSFLGDTSEMYNDFNRVFSRFARENVSDVVIDLRYNGGGYVSVASKLADYLAPSSANGGLMMTQEFNDKYSMFNSTEYFQKSGPLNLHRIFFIVSSSTASASELLINNLKPYMDVQLVGPSRTYGKPVGYFPVPVDKWYIFPVSFKTTNKSGEGSYYNGLALNYQVADGLDKDWGDANESALASTLNFINSGVYRSASAGTQPLSVNQEVILSNKTLDRPNFKGAVDVRGLRH